MTTNELIDRLPADARRFLGPHLVGVELRAGAELHRAHAVAQHVYFPTTALVSLRHQPVPGQRLDVALIDRRGMVGLSALLGADATSAAVLVDGGALRLEAGHLIGEFDRSAAVRQRLLAWVQVVMTQLVWAAACLQNHRPEQRLCTRLSQLSPLQPGQPIALTQQQLGQLIGVRRERINEVLGRLLRLGLIEQGRGEVRVIDPEGVARHACACHAHWLHALQRGWGGPS